MNCPKCEAPGLLVESSPDGKTKKLICHQCGLNEVRDAKGRSLLTEVPHAHPQPQSGSTEGKRLLVEG